MIYPTLDTCKEILTQGEYKRIPIKLEIGSDLLTPIMVIKKLKKVSKHCFMLESATAQKKWGQYTFLGYDPVLELTCENNEVTINCGFELKETNNNPDFFIRKIIKENCAPIVENMPPFTGGLVGYFSYDYIKYSEKNVNLIAKDEEGFKDVDLMMFDKIICFDHFAQTISLIINIETKNIDTTYNNGIRKLHNMKELILNGELDDEEPLKLKSEFEGLFSKSEYCEMVEKAKNYIYEGDIFQIVLSNRFMAKKEGSLLDTYRMLRRINPSPYMFYFTSDDIEIAGASPETLVKLERGQLHTFPLAGTRKRGVSFEEDEHLAKELLEDEKERAEHNMLVDLGRNDLGRISEIGSVIVEKYMQVEKFSHVMHIGSTIKGQLRNGCDALDTINSILPAGTLSGAPKLRACEIICELENNKRGIYGGAIGYIDFTGNLDTCIAIRLAFAKDGKIFVRSGAGIVADSNPESEYEECINKAKAVLNAIKCSEGGIKE
ncbi:MAG: anthranilate synthase component I [Lachnospiraceae bacterium]